MSVERLVRRQRRAAAADVTHDTGRIVYCYVTDADADTATIVLHGLDVPIPKERVYAGGAMPAAGDHAAVDLNGTEPVLIGFSPRP